MKKQNPIEGEKQTLIPKYKIGDTVVLQRRWFLWWREPVFCEIVGGRLVMDIAELEWSNGEPHWRYTLRIGNALKSFCMWEIELQEQDMSGIRNN